MIIIGARQVCAIGERLFVCVCKYKNKCFCQLPYLYANFKTITFSQVLKNKFAPTFMQTWLRKFTTNPFNNCYVAKTGTCLFRRTSTTANFVHMSSRSAIKKMAKAYIHT